MQILFLLSVLCLLCQCKTALSLVLALAALIYPSVVHLISPLIRLFCLFYHFSTTPVFCLGVNDVIGGKPIWYTYQSDE